MNADDLPDGVYAVEYAVDARTSDGRFPGTWLYVRRTRAETGGWSDNWIVEFDNASADTLGYYLNPDGVTWSGFQRRVDAARWTLTEALRLATAAAEILRTTEGRR